MSKWQIGGVLLSVIFIGISIAKAVVPDFPIPNPSSICTLRIKNNTQLEQPITIGSVTLSAAHYNAISLQNGAWGSLSMDCDALVKFSQKPGAGQILSKNSQTTYVMVLPPVNMDQAPKMPPISRLLLGIGAKSQIFITSPNPVCVVPASLCQ